MIESVPTCVWEFTVVLGKIHRGREPRQQKQKIVLERCVSFDLCEVLETYPLGESHFERSGGFLEVNRDQPSAQVRPSY